MLLWFSSVDSEPVALAVFAQCCLVAGHNFLLAISSTMGHWLQNSDVSEVD